MIVVEVVLETFHLMEFTAWPIAEPPADQRLPLSGEMSVAEAATAIAVIFRYGRIPTEPVVDLHHLLDQHLLDAEALIAPGGLRFRDVNAGAEVRPGCCFGLENWRDWQDVVRGESIWLGHDPDAHLEHADGTIQLWQDHHEEPVLPTLEIELDDLPGLLTPAQRQLQGFLGRVRDWATGTTPHAADRLVEVLDHNLRISDPLNLLTPQLR
jgi:hypothetical protein